MRFEINDQNKPEGCRLRIIYQKTTKHRMRKRLIPKGVEVLKFQCMDMSVTNDEGNLPCGVVREVIAGTKGETMDEVIANALITAALIRKVNNCKRICVAAS